MIVGMIQIENKGTPECHRGMQGGRNRAELREGRKGLKQGVAEVVFFLRYDVMTKGTG
ncbi:hypothetical protein [Eisenbergiella tayi]|uniref:hypothetical protein n=1 Tax=Eisenbergiella tayi TaxID=1432052 RepID=UPI00149571B5|nr:hypothetical protein [Eisenbergiella tayi]